MNCHCLRGDLEADFEFLESEIQSQHIKIWTIELWVLISFCQPRFQAITSFRDVQPEQMYSSKPRQTWLDLRKSAMTNPRHKEETAVIQDDHQPKNSQNLCQDSSMGMALGNAFAGPQSSLYLGIDPGLNRTGYALIRRSTQRPILLEGGVISSTKSKTLAERVHEIGSGIREVLAEFSPGAIAIEQVFSMTRNPKTAVLMAHARGAILFAVAETGIPLVHYTPRQIKKLLTGTGTASKEQVQLAVQRELKLKRVLEPNDVADASAIALCHYYSARVNLNESQPCPVI